MHSSSLTIVNYTIGITIMFLPKYLIWTGVGMGTILLLIFAILNYLTCFILVYAARKMKLASYFQIGKKIMAPKYHIIFQFFYLAVLYGNILIYQQFAIQIICFAVKIIFDLPVNQYNILVTILVTIFTHIIIFPFLITKSIKKIHLLSKACTFSFFLSVVILILAFFFPEIFGIKIKPIDPDHIVYFTKNGIFISFGFYMLGFVQQLIVIEVDKEIIPNSL